MVPPDSNDTSAGTGDIAPDSKTDTAGSGGDVQSAAVHPQPTRATRPVQIAGHYPVRTVTWYHINSSDMRSIGVAQAVATVSAALGTFALSIYLEFSKDIGLLAEKNETVPGFLSAVNAIAFWAWLVFWGIALASLGWQGLELRRIKLEHNEPTFLGALARYWRRE